jgi:hypothetical protein
MVRSEAGGVARHFFCVRETAKRSPGRVAQLSKRFPRGDTGLKIRGLMLTVLADALIS